MNAVTTKDRVTIPRAIRDTLDIGPSTPVDFAMNRHGEVVLRKGGSDQMPASRFDRLVGSAGSGMTTDEVMALMGGSD